MTERGLEILQLLSEGLVSKEIGAKLGLSSRTIEGQVENMLKENGLKSRFQLAIWAIDNGFIILPSKEKDLARRLTLCIWPYRYKPYYQMPCNESSQ